MLRCAFYLVADASYFVGAAAALNSLRLCGHRDDAYVLDVGLTAEQRAALARAATVLPAPENVAPRLAKWVAPLAHPADVMVVMDADVIVTRRLTRCSSRRPRGRLSRSPTTSRTFTTRNGRSSSAWTRCRAGRS